MRSAARLRRSSITAATVLCCTPTYAHAAGGGGRPKRDIDLSAAKVRRIIVAGEPGGSIPASRTRI